VKRVNDNLRSERARPENDLLEVIAKEEARLASLDAERAKIQQRLATLKSQVATTDAVPEIRVPLPVLPTAPRPDTPAAKLRLFRQLFRGRVDVFPTRFVSKKTGKPGYAPALRKQVRSRTLRVAEDQVRGLRQPSVYRGQRRCGARPFAGPARHGRLPIAGRRDMLVARRRF